MAADPIAKLRSAGMSLPPKVRAEVLALAPGIIPRLVDVLEDVDGDCAPVHAADLLVDLKAEAAIEPMLRALADLDFEYAKPIIDAMDGSLGSMQMALNMGMLFWNISILRDETARQEALAEMARQVDESERPEFEQTARMMIDRHRAMFPELHRGR